MAQLWQLYFGMVVVLCYISSNKHTLALRININRTTPTTTTTTAPTNEVANVTTSTSSIRRAPIFINNKIPSVDASCMIRYKCAEKLKGVTVSPKPCVKYCVKFIECPNAQKIRGTADQCVELDQTAVREQHEKDVQDGNTVHVMKVAMIDFPCRPGFLPDDMGRCREVW